MVTLVIAARIGKPIQSASVKEGMNCLPELTSPCVPESQDTADVGGFPPPLSRLSSTWAHSQAGCALWWPPAAGSLPWPSIATSASREGTGASPANTSAEVPGRVIVTPAWSCARSLVGPCGGWGLRLDRCSPMGSLGGHCQLKREGLRGAKRLFVSRN